MKQTIQAGLVQMLEYVLRPLIQFLIYSGFTYPQFIQVVRKLYVDLAENNRDEKGQAPTASRVSLLTGIARRYIREIRQQQTQGEQRPQKWSPGARLIAEWTTHPRFIDPQGKPLSLLRYADDSKAPSFEELATMASTEIRSRTQLEHLLERRLVSVSDDNCVHLLDQAYQSGGDQVERLHILGEHLHDHIAAGVHNLDETSHRFFERSAFQGDLSEASISALQTMLEQEGMHTLRKVYARAAELAKEDKNKGSQKSNGRFRLGIYSFTAEKPVAKPDDAAGGPSSKD